MKNLEDNSHRQDRISSSDLDILPSPVTRSWSLLKKVAAIAGYKLGHIPKYVAVVIISAVNDLLEEKEYGKERQAMAIFEDEALLNAAVNKKIIDAANSAKTARPGRKVVIQAEEHLDLGQHSVCTLLNAIRVALVVETYRATLPTLRRQAAILREKSRKTAIGTQNGEDWAAQFEKTSAEIERAVAPMMSLGAQTFPSTPKDAESLRKFGNICMTYLASVTGQPFSFASAALSPTAIIDEFFKLSSALSSHAMNLLLITHRMRWLVEGSESLYAGRLLGADSKANMGRWEISRLSDAVSLQCVQILGGDATLSVTGRQGYFESSFHIMVMAQCLLTSLHQLVDAHLLFDECLEKFGAIEQAAGVDTAPKAEKSVRSPAPWYAPERFPLREDNTIL